MDENPNRTIWYRLSLDDIFKLLDGTPSGLSSDEASRRLLRFGPNDFHEQPIANPWILFLRQFKSLLVWILLVAAAVSALLGEWLDSGAIAAIVVLNAIIGFYQEYGAERAIASLKQMTSPQARVVREGQTQLIPARDVVPGDILSLVAGDLIPADARILDASSLACNEASLTGESEAVIKVAETLDEEGLGIGDRINMVFMGTSVAAGIGRAIAIETGMRTEIGRIAELITMSEDEETPLQKRLSRLGNLLVWAAGAIVVMTFLLGFLRGMPLLELFMTSVSLAVAAVPEGLPAIVTIALAVGVQRMAKRRALIRQLTAVETLGSTTVICTDKTGTLTVGEMTVRALYVAENTYRVSGEGYAPIGEICREDDQNLSDREVKNLRHLLTLLTGCNDAELHQVGTEWRVAGDPTEGALLAAAGKFGVQHREVDEHYPQVRELPFDSDRKRMSVIRETPEGLQSWVKGAPDMMLPHCTHILTGDGLQLLNDAHRQEIVTRNAEMADQALRVLAAAYRNVKEDPFKIGEREAENHLIFVGLVGMHDPPRAEAKQAVAACHSAGIHVVMITGDHPQTALAIARGLGIADENSVAVTGRELDTLSDERLNVVVRDLSVFARVSAEHKLRIVRAWRSHRDIIAMTGDGVNDAPAIKGAHVGIGMGKGGTEVTKEVSDIVIADDNFASIVSAVEEGRGVYDNIRKTLLYLLASNTGELLFITVALLIALPIPLMPIHLLWINLVTDGLPALALATDPLDPDTMKRPPRNPDEEMTDRGFFLKIIGVGALTAGVSLGAYLYGLAYYSEAIARSAAFSTLVYAQMLYAFSARSEAKTLWELGFGSNRRLVLIAIAIISLQFAITHFESLGRFFQAAPLSWEFSFVLLGIGAIPLLILELYKVVSRRH